MIVSGTPMSFRVELLKAIHDFENDTFKIALYTASATLAPGSTTTYTTAGEVVAANYVAGGVALTGATVSTDQQKAVVDFDNVTVPGDGMFVAGALIYNASKGNRAVRIIEFNTSNAVTDPIIRIPTATADTAIIRI